MRKITLALILILFCTNIFAQEEKLSEYPGGEKAFKEYFTKGLVLSNKIKEGVINKDYSFSFVVTEENIIEEVDCPSYPNDENIQKQIVERVEKMPKWKNERNSYTDLHVDVNLSFTSIGIICHYEKIYIRKQISIADVIGYTDVVDENPNNSSTQIEAFVSVEHMPSFVGGEGEMNKYIMENLRYPEEAQKNGIQGRVAVRFVVDEDGSLSDIKIIRGVDEQLDKEVIRIIKNMPKWNPGKQNGKEVPVYFTLPVVFRLK